MGGMRDSGVEWIGEMPKDWNDCTPLRFCASLKSATSPFDPDKPYLALENISSWTGKVVSEEQPDQVDSLVANYSRNDVLFGKLRPYLAKVVRPTADGQCSTELLPISPTSFDRGYLFWLLINKGFIDTVNSMTYGVKMPRTSWLQLGALYCPVPPWKEQAKIAAFLDNRCAQIDNVSQALESQIAILERYRASVIHEAVTRGLDLTAPTKPSGIDWIGSVPLSWDVKRLKYTLQFFDHLRAPVEASLRSQEKDTLYPYYGASGAIDMIDDYNVEGDMILIGEDGANLVRRTLPLSYIATGKYWVNNHAHILRPLEGCLRYYYYALEACDYTTFITGSPQPKLSQQKLSNVWLPQPTLSEQSAIADYLDTRTSAIDAVLGTKRKQLDILKRRRQSLIYEYVTGKRRVTEED